MPDESDQLLVEITRMGTWLKVAVLDPATGREAVVRGPDVAGQEALIRLARRRLADRPNPRRPAGLVV